ncbi:acyltransferase family protein [Bradyrhizobium sp.]|uniref:acyltransferase family protein n=1 Tax=Bradyrhizobium sp. TaxID=376 RepID=UPI003C6371B0
MNDLSAEPERLHYLDGLRGIAALVVFATHLSIVIFPSIFNGLPIMSRLDYEWKLAGTPLGILWAANFAVCIFFVMSALVLSRFYEREGDNFLAVCIRRYLRLALPILATSFFVYLLWTSGAMFNLKAQQITQEGWLKSQYLTAAPGFWQFLSESLYQVFRVPTSEFNPALWTMKYEMAGSVGVFALYALVPQRLLRIPVLLLCLTVLFKTYYMCFVGGILIYEWMKLSPAIKLSLPNWVSWMLLVFGAYLGAFPYNVATPENIWFGRMLFLDVEEWHMIGAIPLVFACVTLVPVKRFFTLAPLQYLGKISFALYLVHGPMICSLMSFLIVSFYWPPHARAAMFLGVIAVVPATFLVAHYVAKWIDQPAVRISVIASRYLNRISKGSFAGTEKWRPAPKVEQTGSRRNKSVKEPIAVEAPASGL